MGRVVRRLILSDLNHIEEQARSHERVLRTLKDELDALRSRADLGSDAGDRFLAVRRTADYQAAYEDPHPLVSVCIATYNRARLLTERCLPSILCQTYDHLEVLVVGDGCTDDTETRVRALADSRLYFENLRERGRYPEDSYLRWMVAGTAAMNRALALANGRFVTHLDDDDEAAPERIERLIALLKESRFDLAWHPFDCQSQDGAWRRNEAREFRFSQVTTSSVFYHAWFARIPWDADAFKYREPGDWNRFRKIKWLGANVIRHPDCLVRHYRERSNEA